MRRLLLSMLAAATFGCGETRFRDPELAGLAGHWSGEGTFFNAELQRKAGSLPFDVQLAPDLSGTGTIGGATMEVVSVAKAGDHIEVRAVLRGSIGGDPALKKDHLILLITSVGDGSMQAEFHLKSSFIFDLSGMREGRVAFTRK